MITGSIDRTMKYSGLLTESILRVASFIAYQKYFIPSNFASEPPHTEKDYIPTYHTHLLI
jgi:hypothetical protein